MRTPSGFLSKALGSLCILWLFTGCVSTPQLYHWGNYESIIYSGFSTSSTPEQQIEEMERILHTNTTQRPVPPGFHAHLGMLYGETGGIAEMREQFILEKNLYPESTAFMDFLLTRSKQTKEVEP